MYYNIKTIVSARKHLTLTCLSSFATSLKIAVKRMFITERLLKKLNLPVKTSIDLIDLLYLVYRLLVLGAEGSALRKTKTLI